MRGLAAYTAPTGPGFPPFISINEVAGGVSFYIREPALPADDAVPYLHEGPKAAVVIDREEAKRLLRDALTKLEVPR
jgi:hypothetical protein